MHASKHILGAFEDSLGALREEVLRMASLASQNLRHAMGGLFNRDDDACNRVIAEDEEVDQLEKSVDRHGLDIILRFAPVARDLRHVISTMKMSNNLERVSDHAVNIAKRARRMNRHSELKDVKLIGPLYDLALSMLSDSVGAFKEGDVEASIALDQRDEELDSLHKTLIKKFTAQMETDSSRVEDYLDLIFIVRFLERIGDHAVNIGEDCVYAESAHDIRHGGSPPPAKPKG